MGIAERVAARAMQAQRTASKQSQDDLFRGMVQHVDQITHVRRHIEAATGDLDDLVDVSKTVFPKGSNLEYGAAQAINAFREVLLKLSSDIEGVEKEYDQLNAWFLKHGRDR